MKQTTFASMSFTAKKRRARREKFLAEMEQVVPWAQLVAVIEPRYPKAGRRGRPPPYPARVVWGQALDRVGNKSQADDLLQTCTAHETL